MHETFLPIKLKGISVESSQSYDNKVYVVAYVGKTLLLKGGNSKQVAINLLHRKLRKELNEEFGVVFIDEIYGDNNIEDQINQSVEYYRKSMGMLPSKIIISDKLFGKFVEYLRELNEHKYMSEGYKLFGVKVAKESEWLKSLREE